MSKGPGSYVNPVITYTEQTTELRGRPLLSAPLTFAVMAKEGEEAGSVRVEFLKPKKRKGEESVRVKIGRTTFSLAVITPRGSKESYVDAMFEDAEGFIIDGDPRIALMFLQLDHAAREGAEQALGAAAAAEWGLFTIRCWSQREGAAVPSAA